MKLWQFEWWKLEKSDGGDAANIQDKGNRKLKTWRHERMRMDGGTQPLKCCLWPGCKWLVVPSLKTRLFHPQASRGVTGPCWLQRAVSCWGWVWPHCELWPKLYLSIYSLNSSLPLPHLCARPPLPAPSLPSFSSSTLSWSCLSQSSKPLDPSSCSGCSGSLWCGKPARAMPPALAPPRRLWPGSKPAPGGCGKEWSKQWRPPIRWPAAWQHGPSWPCSAGASGLDWRRENKRRAGWSPPQWAEEGGTPGWWGRTGQGGAHRKSWTPTPWSAEKKREEEWDEGRTDLKCSVSTSACCVCTAYCTSSPGKSRSPQLRWTTLRRWHTWLLPLSSIDGEYWTHGRQRGTDLHRYWNEGESQREAQKVFAVRADSVYSFYMLNEGVTHLTYLVRNRILQYMLTK